jgi:hypothetical protein
MDLTQKGGEMANQLTQKMQSFIQKNNQLKIVFGERLTTEGKPIFDKRDMENSDRVFYRFSNGDGVTLTDKDMENSTYTPVWQL